MPLDVLVYDIDRCFAYLAKKKLQKANALPEDFPLFTVQGGMNKTKLHRFNKLMINMLTKGLASQKERTETDERMLYLLTHN